MRLRAAALVLVAGLSGCSPAAPSLAALAATDPIRPPPTASAEPAATPVPKPTNTLPPPTATAPEPFIVVTELGPILGTWRFSDSDFTRFYADQTMHEAYSLDQLDGDPFAVNRFEFEDAHLLARELSVSGVPPCGAGKIGVYELRLLQSGDLQIVVIKDTCGPRAGDLQGVYERLP